MEVRTKKVLGWAAALIGTAAAARRLMVRSWERKWGAAPIDVKRPMPGDELVDDPTVITNRAFVIEAMPVDIWPALAERAGGKLEEGDILSMGAAGSLRVEAVNPNHDLVLVPADDGHKRQASWSLLVEPFATNRSRLLYRARLDFGWGPSDLVYRVGLDEAAFMGIRDWIIEAKTRAENASMIRRQHEILEQRLKPQREYRPRQHLGGGSAPPA
ncbi:hypothetical protein FIV42_25640 [Persicimonas caeni]|uniref:SRPBCC family protein n=1 Tax=Persicimonas caeni TaxID=2292766 RepID=A0A4Y6Q0I6_PERCE|nr:hypothetical protein [Persicimonas caeni]QDG54000.1 hypothetical protein FIV42_25640 [Persicimonas caeni]QED35221.1 hypothetical protein FRD00_25635 [Persicimonas caeni]